MAELSDFGLSFNPFESAGSGAPIGNSELWMPERWLSHFNSFFDRMNRVEGAKAYAVLGEYGSGKSYILRWLEREKFPALRIRSFYFDTPGVQFYDLANYLLKQIGREPFAKVT